MKGSPKKNTVGSKESESLSWKAGGGLDSEAESRK